MACSVLTFATLAMTAAIINTEKIHNGPGRKEARAGGGGGVPGPEAGVGVDGQPAVLLDPVQVQPGVPRVSRVLENERKFESINEVIISSLRRDVTQW